MKNIITNSPAKINLFFEILDKRPDNYHNIISIIHEIPLYDRIYLDIVPDNQQKINISCEFHGVPCDSRNTVYKVIEIFTKRFNISDSFYVKIKKNIPIGGGLGGGSSNAVSVAKRLNEYYNTHLNKEGLVDLVLELGADMPYFVYGGSCLVECTGEKVTFLKRTIFKCFLLLIKPEFSIDTTWAYKYYDDNLKNKHTTKKDINDLLHGLLHGIKIQDLCLIQSNLYNDFQKIISIKYPEIDSIVNFMVDNGAMNAIMTGSGSCVYGIFSDSDTLYKCLNCIFKLQFNFTHFVLAI